MQIRTSRFLRWVLLLLLSFLLLLLFLLFRRGSAVYLARSLGLLLLLLFLWLLCGLRALSVATSRSSIPFSFLVFLLLFGCLYLGEFFQLRLGRFALTQIREAHEEAEIINQLVEAWQMLYMVNPPESMTILDFLEVHELLEVRRNVQARYYVGSRDICANEEHLHGQMFVDKLGQLLPCHSLSKFDEAENFCPLLRVVFSKQYFL